MMNIAIYTLTSGLHDEQTVSAVTAEFLGSLGFEYEFRGSDYADYGTRPLSLIYVRTGGTEGIFRRLLPQLQGQSEQPFYLLTSGKSNSLAASMEILSYLRQQGLRGEILHGSPDYIRHRVSILEKVSEARHQLCGKRYGIIGQPSDWLISSTVDRNAVHEKLGIRLIDIPMQELLDTIAVTPKTQPEQSSERVDIQAALPGANQIYEALRLLVEKYELSGFTLRCFDLLTAVHNTGCLALAKFNADGIVAGCEGDVPAMLTMAVSQVLFGLSGFQANPARINPETGEMLFAHCTIPLNMVERYELDTHFESGFGVGIRGYVRTGAVTIFKVSGDLSRSFVAEGELLRNQAESNLCRTQQVVRMTDKSRTSYFLTEPIGNHHIILPGHHKEKLEEFLRFLSPS